MPAMYAQCTARRVQIETTLHCLSSTTYDTEVDHGLFDNKTARGKREIAMTCQSNIYARGCVALGDHQTASFENQKLSE
jgi:hypothetical protein